MPASRTPDAAPGPHEPRARVRPARLDALPERVDVLVVGAGPVGSALALELARRGVRPLVLERHEEIPTAGVRARNISLRTMELAREWGIAADLRRDRALPESWYRGWRAVARVAGHAYTEQLLDDRPMWAPTAPWPQIGVEPPLDLPQYRFNRVVRDRALQLGARIAVGWTLEGLDQDDDGVTVTARDARTDEVATLRAGWVVGADGSRSLVRRSAGIEQDATEPVGRMLNVTFRFPDAFAQLGIEPGVQFMVQNADVGGLAHPYEEDRWRIGMGPLPLDVDPETIDLRAQIGLFLGIDAQIDDLHVSTHLVQSKVARRYREGRLLIAGDAAVAFPPHLGQNLNAGVADAATLGWTLAAITQGWGGETLLDAYGHERRRSAQQLTTGTLLAVDRFIELDRLIRTSPELEHDTDEGARARRAVGEVFGPLLGSTADGVIFDHRHPESPIVLSDGSEPPPYDPAHYRPAALAGHRAPPVWIGPDAPLSDRFGTWFTLLDTGAAPGDVDRIVDAAARLDVPLTVVHTREPSAVAAFDAPLVVIRPDRIVAWRGAAAPADPVALLRTLAGRDVPAPTAARPPLLAKASA